MVISVMTIMITESYSKWLYLRMDLTKDEGKMKEEIEDKVRFDCEES